MENEIILYQNDALACHLEVKIHEDSVWLNRKQMSALFDRDIKTIGKHINNSLKEELNGISVVANFATTASDGKVYNTAYCKFQTHIRCITNGRKLTFSFFHLPEISFFCMKS